MAHGIHNELTGAEMQKILKDYFGNQTEESSRRRLGGGVYNLTYHVVTKAGEDIVIRIAPTDKSGLFEYERYMMCGEQYYSELMLANGVPTCRIYKYAPFGEVIEREYLVMEYIDSLPLNSDEVPKEQHTKLYSQAGGCLKKIHQIKVTGENGDKFGWLHKDCEKYFSPTYKPYDKWSDFLCRYRDEIIDKALEYEVFSETEMMKFKSIFEPASRFDVITESKMNHADLWQPNVLVTEKGGEWNVTAIIDADRSVFGDTLWDMSLRWMMTADFLEGYGGEPEYSKEERYRMAVYKSLFDFSSACFWKIQYGNEDAVKNERKNALSNFETIDKIFD